MGRKPVPDGSGTRGFTLVELLVSMTLFLVLGTALIALLTRAFDFLNTGTAGAEVLDKATDFLRPFKEDVDNVVVERSQGPGEPRIRFLSDYVPIDSNEDGNADYMAQRLAFVRSTSGEAADREMRLRGTLPAGTDSEVEPEEGSEEEIRSRPAAGGLEEVLWMAVPDDPKDPGVLTLYRGTRSPPGGEGSLCDRGTVRNADDLRKIAEPVLTGVLHFAVLFWHAKTKSWETSLRLASEEGPSMSWDSTRGILPRGLKMNQFLYARGKESLTDPRDDVSPRQIHVTFVYERTGRDNLVGYLDEDLSDAKKQVSVTTSAFATTSKEKFIKVGSEWMSWSSMRPGTFQVLARGVRGTKAVTHTAGETVRSGYTLTRTILIPAYREDWNFK